MGRTLQQNPQGVPGLAIPAAASGHLPGADAAAAIIVGVAGIVLLGLTVTGRWRPRCDGSGGRRRAAA